MKITLITVLYNHLHEVTIPFVKNVLEMTRDVEFELIMVDNGGDGAQAHFKKHPHRNVTYIKSPKNVGYGSGMNLGYKQATGEVIVFLNNDIEIIDHEWAKQLLSAVAAAPQTIFGPQLVTTNNATAFRGKNTPYLNGWFVAGTKATFDALAEKGNVWDENFFLYFEDVELSARTVHRGYQLKEINLQIKHLGSKSSGRTDIAAYTKKSLTYFTHKMMLMHLEKVKKKRIVFYFQSSYGFIDDDYEGKGVGGAESALILLTREFAKAGWQVEVYNTTQVSGVFNGVEYYHISEFRPLDYMDVFVLFRMPYVYLPDVNAVMKLFWSCDQWTTGYWPLQVFPFVDAVVAISPYHAKYLERIYGPIEEKVRVIDLIIQTTDYQKLPEKEKGKLIYCSVPMRGLKNLEGLFQRIKERVPDAQLYITSDYRLWGLDYPDNEQFQAMFQGVTGVHFLGKIPHRDMAAHQLTAEVMVYPCNYEECFCIAAAECIAAGAVPVTTSIGALPTTVKEDGIVLKEKVETLEYQDQFVESVVALLSNPDYANQLREQGRKRVLTQYSGAVVLKQWLQLFADLEIKGGETMVFCDYCGEKQQNSYLLTKHIAQKHAAVERELKELAIEQAAGPKLQKLRFTRSVAFNINGQQFSGIEIFVPFEMVSSAVDIVRTAYGDDVMDF